MVLADWVEWVAVRDPVEPLPYPVAVWVAEVVELAELVVVTPVSMLAVR